MPYRVLALLPILALVAACEQAGSSAPIGADLTGPEPLVEGIAQPTDGLANETEVN
jgi:hypothetical protein